MSTFKLEHALTPDEMTVLYDHLKLLLGTHILDVASVSNPLFSKPSGRSYSMFDEVTFAWQAGNADRPQHPNCRCAVEWTAWGTPVDGYEPPIRVVRQAKVQVRDVATGQAVEIGGEVIEGRVHRA